ncbi:U-box domain-containing protein 35-like [Argentina anserina]|uniref:U-box domain-containing protein 35-like n=1 Tax=Argentina anserina TaxID=57926 RepID=UPI0021765793|nr:U-box domain-containing protein 35-like [Potentilla anserina]
MWGYNKGGNAMKTKGGGAGGGGKGLVSVAIDKDKGSQNALRWAAENILTRGQAVVLIHVVHRQNATNSLAGANALICDTNNTPSSPHKQQLENMTKNLFLTYHCYCTRKDIQCLDVILEDTDIAKALTEYVSYAAIETLVVGAPAKHGFMRFKSSNMASSVSKGAPDFCTVYAISKGKISSQRSASRAAPYTSPLLSTIESLNNQAASKASETPKNMYLKAKPSFKPRHLPEDPFRSPFARGGGGFTKGRISGGFSESESDISFISSDRASTDRASSVMYEYIDQGRGGRLSTSSDHSFGSTRMGPRLDLNAMHDFSMVSQDTSLTSSSWSSQNLDEVEAEMRRLKLELKQTMDMYSTACREALTAKQKEMELHNWKAVEEQKLEEARLAQEAAIAVAEKEKARCKAAMEAADAAKRIAELESQKRAHTEMRALREAEEMRKVLDNLAQTDTKYRRYSIQEIEAATEHFTPSRKIGEGGYGPVYKCYLDHTSVAVKVLRPDAAQGRSQFQQEIDILSCIRHPNMVLLLGACPEYGILVYEYMANGSLEDRLTRKGNSPPLSWQLRFRIAAEIATGLLFLHQTKPEPLVHRDLKPGNILLDHNYVSKISDVGLARLVPAIAENVTQYLMTSTAGTFCYIDPEYQQTGMLGVKSDVYSLGIMLLQLITSKPPMGLTHLVERAIERDKFAEVLDPDVLDWPVEEALKLAKLALQCAELRRKDRPDLCTVVLPELTKLRELGEENMTFTFSGGGTGPNSTTNSNVDQQEIIVSDPQLKSHSSTSSQPENQQGS